MTDAKDEQRIAELETQVRAYKHLEEDLMSSRLFVTARNRLLRWLTVGGVALAIVSAIGVGKIASYTRGVVSKKVHKVADDQVRRTLVIEGRKQVAVIVSQQRDSMEAYANQRINQLVGYLPISAAGKHTARRSAALAAPERRADVDYSARMLPVRDSGSEGSVVGFAVASALEFQIRKHDGQTVRVSPRYLYYGARKLGGIDLHSDGGANLRDAVTVVSDQGAVAESAWPYKSGEFEQAPPDGIDGAKRYRARSRPLKGASEVKSALQHYGPVVIGVTIYDSFNSANAISTGRIPDPKPTESIVGGHAICIVGYDDTKRRFRFENSWGADWGDKGYGYLSYNYVQKYGADAWALSL
jgi:C1A family cysteine protease